MRKGNSGVSAGRKRRDGALRIVMLGHKRIPSREGGIEIVVDELASRMAEKRFAVTCINRGGHHVSGRQFDEARRKEYRGIRLITVPTIDKRGLAAVSASFFGSLAAAFGPWDIVHFHAEGPCAFLWIPKLTGKKCIATIHGLDWKRAKWGRFASWFIRTGEKTAARFADAVIVLNRNEQDYFLERYGRKTVCIPNGVTRPRIAGADRIREKWGLEKDGYLLYLSRLVPEKGLGYLVRAFQKLDTEKKLVIAGGDSDAPDFVREIKALAASDPRILFTGFVQGQELEELYSNAYLYLLPSDVEGMPLSLLEAMSYGNCCVTSDIRECADVTGKWGFSFEKGNEDALRKLLQELCGDPGKVREIRAGAADAVCGKYSWEDAAEKNLKVYRRVLAKGRI